MQRNELGQVGREEHCRQQEQHVLRSVGGVTWPAWVGRKASVTGVESEGRVTRMEKLAGPYPEAS